jgi:hypothetical protein
MTPGFYGNFQPQLGLYYVGPGIDFLSEHFMLSAINPQEPASQKQDLHAVTFHKGPGILQMTLYSTTTHGSAPISIAKNDHRYSSSTDITLPAPLGGTERTERLQYGTIGSNSYTITIDGETFRWRQDKAKSPKVMRLVRHNPTISEGSEASGLIEKSGKSDPTLALLMVLTLRWTAQPEVVATWTEGSVPNRDARLAIFQCYSSDTMRQLGEYGTLLAISSALVICQRGAAIEGVWLLNLGAGGC